MSSLLKDNRVRFAFAVAVAEWFIVGGLVVVIGEDRPIILGVLLLIATWLQLGALFFRPRPMGLFPDAQAAFMHGDYETAIGKLKTLLAQDGDHVQGITLLGNAYRQSGDVETSERILREAVEKFPTEDFPLYGLGRTLLVSGQYHAAAEMIRQALEHGGRKPLRADLALALFLADESNEALAQAQQAAKILSLEAHRTW